MKTLEKIGFYAGILFLVFCAVAVWFLKGEKGILPISDLTKNVLITIAIGTIIFLAIWNRRKTQNENSQNEGD